MLPIEIKSTGTLVDELLTTEFKIAAGNEAAKERRHQLGNAVQSRMLGLIEDLTKYRQFIQLQTELKAVLWECWLAQETVHETPIEDYSGTLTEMQLYDNIVAVAKSGRKAQETNAARNVLIRKIDALLEEDTQLEKTYA